MTDSSNAHSTDTAEPPCIGLDPDTYECPFCGATLDDECGTPGGARPIARLGGPSQGSLVFGRCSRL